MIVNIVLWVWLIVAVVAFIVTMKEDYESDYGITIGDIMLNIIGGLLWPFYASSLFEMMGIILEDIKYVDRIAKLWRKVLDYQVIKVRGV